MKRIALIAITALLLAAGAGVVLPVTANAQVNFSDGIVMMGSFNCRDQFAYSNPAAAMGLASSFFQSQPAQGYFRTWIYNHQTRTWLPPSSWRTMGTSTWLFYGPERWPLGRGYFTIQAELGRYINGRFVSAYDTPNAATCFFVG